MSGTSGSTSTSGTMSGSASRDDQRLLSGMSSAGQDPAYKQAFLDCMKRRGF